MCCALHQIVLSICHFRVMIRINMVSARIVGVGIPVPVDGYI